MAQQNLVGVILLFVRATKQSQAYPLKDQQGELSLHHIILRILYQFLLDHYLSMHPTFLIDP
ncbi:MAG: hypothetical protein EBQ89_06005 [Alphaproteobacteria bacterium]|nr:hypothetical protein [Alphaproteobacteria bacterium]